MPTTNPFVGAVRYLTVFSRLVGRRLYVVFILTTLAALSEGLGIALIVPLLGTLQVSTGPASSIALWLRDALRTVGVEPSLTWILTLIAGAFLLKALIGISTKAYGAYLQAQLLRELQSELFDAYGRMDYRYYAANTTGHFVNVIAGQTNGLFGAFAAYVDFLSRFLQAIVYAAIAVWMSWQFGLVAIVLAVGLFSVFRRLNRYVRDLSRLTARESSQLKHLFVQFIQAFKYLVSTGQTQRRRPDVLRSIHRLTGYQLRRGVWSAVTASVAEPLSVVFVIGVVMMQVQVLERPIEPILVAMLLFHRTIGSLLAVQGHWQTMLGKIGSLEMVEDERAALRQNVGEGGSRVLTALREGIAFDNVSFAYDGDSAEVIRSLSFEIPVRSTVAIVGESGAGKSTTVDLVTLLLQPTSGEVRIDGVPAGELDPLSWRSKIGYVAQETVVFDDTIAGNIAMQSLADDPATELMDRVRQAAEKANIARFVEGLPQGYLTRVGDRGVRLSGGQRQRLSIARELFRRPEVLIMDEATSSLDTESEIQIQRSVDGLRGEMTLLIIAHRLSTIRNADIVLVLQDGKLIEQGPYQELRDRAGSRLGAMIELQRL